MADNVQTKGQKDYARDKEISDFIGVKVRKSTGMLNALNEMMDDTGMSKNAYIIETVCARLREEGYLKD